MLCAVPSVVSDFVDPVDCCPPGKNTGVGRHALLQEIFPARGWNPSLCRLHWQAGSLASALPGQLLPPCFTPSPLLNSPGALLVHSDAFPVSLPCCVMTANPASIPGARKPGPGDTSSNAFSFFSVVILCYSPLLFSCLFCCCLLFLVRIDLQYCVSFSYTHIYIQILFHYRLLQILYEFPALFSESFLFTCFIHSGINLLIQYCYFGPSSPFPLW